MTFIGYHASQEQHPPSKLLAAVIAAEAVGFDGAFSADHLAPWTPSQGEAGNTLVWLGAALARTTFPIGAVATPGYRYHPVVMAHAFATLAEMFPGRYFAALGSGELLNEHVTGEPWPSKPEREARLLETQEVIRALLSGREVTHHGRITVDRARLWTLPSEPPPLLATATSPQTAAWAASWADGLITVGTSVEQLTPILAAYREAGGRGEAMVQVHLAHAPTQEEASAIIQGQWRHGVVRPPRTWDVATPQDFARLSADADDAELRQEVITSNDLGEIAQRIAQVVAIGFDRVYLHDVGQDQERFLHEVAPTLLAAIRGGDSSPGKARQRIR